ncbi:hypothetical protein LCGC14_0750270 [marine sediment metagenome]|uniref:Uncharacterized protein n=1 Tax=marine sediment metagenome TaxID=412755 RepID=A0A0F9Q8I1_9ZZZZ
MPEAGSRLTSVSAAAREEGRHETPGESIYASRSVNMYDKNDRTKPVFGLVVHTTGGGAPNAAKKERISVLEWCVARYERTYGCHYVNGYDGVDGDLIQVGNEYEKPHTVGMKEQNASIRAGTWKTDISKKTLKHWRAHWPTRANPLKLFPGSSANNVYVGMECPPCVWWDRKLKRTVSSPKPMRPGLRFTEAQHDAVVLLSIDLAERHNWPDGWWLLPRLVGHEDLSPIVRSTKTGGWDPGFLRDRPYFDWDYVKVEIETVVG